MALRSVRAFEREFDLVVEREKGQVRVTVKQGRRTVCDRILDASGYVDVILR